MSRIKYCLILFLISLLIASCSTLKTAQLTNDLISLDEYNMNKINGTYNRLSNDSTYSNASDLFWLFAMKGINTDEKENLVSFNVIDERHIEVKLIQNDSTIYSRISKGKLKNGLFEFNRRVKFLPIIVATIYFDSKTRIGILNNGDLIVDAKSMEYGLTMFVLPLGGSDKRYNSVFERQTDNSNNKN